jgi:hypothetical protein
VGVSIDKAVSDSRYNFSTGLVGWDNAGMHEDVEQYFSFGADIKTKIKFLNSLFLNKINGSYTYNSSLTLALDENKDKTISVDGRVSNSYYGPSYDLMFKKHLSF